MRMTSTPETRLIALVYWIINDPSAPTNPPMTRNTAVKPATNSTAPVTRRHGRSPGSLVRRGPARSEEHTSELQSRGHLVCRLLLEKKKKDGACPQRRRV